MWIEEISIFEELDEDFQIVIEAIGGRVHLSEIAIDDFALLNGVDCIGTEQQSTTQALDEETNGVFDIQSCLNRCNETEPSSVRDETIGVDLAGKGGIIETCDCHPECEELKSCCLDFRTICVFGTDHIPSRRNYTSMFGFFCRYGD